MKQVFLTSIGITTQQEMQKLEGMSEREMALYVEEKVNDLLASHNTLFGYGSDENGKEEIEDDEDVEEEEEDEKPSMP